MTDKVQLIRAEVERHKQEILDLWKGPYGFHTSVHDGHIMCCDIILSFIDSLHERPVSQDLEEAARNYGDELDNVIAVGVDDDNTIGEYAQEAFKVGAKWQKQQLMKKAIEGIVTTNIDGWINVMTGFIRPEEAGANFGNKVKLIIIKEDKI